jgi:general secretion pathway protein K
MSMAGKQRGVALVAVLLIFALVGVLATGMINRQRLQINQSINIIGQAQAQQYAMGVEYFAFDVLRKSFERQKQKNRFVDSEEELKYSIVYGEALFAVEGQIDDLQARFNINSLIDKQGRVVKAQRDRFEVLLFNLGVTAIRVDAVIDWLDPDDQVNQAGGAEDETYLIKDAPYRTGNGPMLSVSELLLVDGVTREDYDRLEPHITALPSTVQQINVNTASPVILRTFDRRITQQQAETLVKNRPNDGFATLEDFLADNELRGLDLKKEKVQLIASVKSDYFQLTARALFDERNSRLVSVIKRDDKDGSVQVLRRDQGQKYPITKEVMKL